MLLLLALAEVLGMSLWFSASAVAGPLRAMWGLTVAESGWLTTSVQLGSSGVLAAWRSTMQLLAPLQAKNNQSGLSAVPGQWTPSPTARP